MGLEPADETLGRYRLFARLSRGGMAELHLARMLGPARVEKFVVIKRMLQHLADDPQFVTMFENEGRIAVRLDHPNVCQTYELGHIDDQLFLVMELVRGLAWSTVATRLPRDDLAACQFIVGVMTQACEGLHYAHNLTDAAGNPSPVVHRDVTPGNLMITKEGAIKLLDFGVSKLLTDDHATRAGMIKGKLPYMAPEHIRGELVDRRADIFSLAVVTWEALAQRRLFERPSDLKIFKAIVEEPIPALPQTPITQRLEVVLRRALAKDKLERHASARELADDLRETLAPFGPPMTQGQIQRAMSEWLAAELAQADEDLAQAISRVRASDGPRPQPSGDVTRTEVDFIVGRATETWIGAVSDVDADTEDDPGPAPGQEMKTLELPPRTPSVPVQPVFDETAEPSISSAPTAPRPLPVRILAASTTIEAAPTRKIQAATPAPRSTQTGPAPAASRTTPPPIRQSVRTPPQPVASVPPPPMPQQVAPQQVAPQQVAPQQVAPQQVAPQQVSPTPEQVHPAMQSSLPWQRFEAPTQARTLPKLPPRTKAEERAAQARRRRWLVITLVVASTAIGVIAAILSN